MPKRDLKKEMKSLYSAPREPVVVDVPPLPYLMIDGEGAPGSSRAYVEAVEALFSVAYTVKFACKQAGTDFAVLPLEGLWWANDMSAFLRRDKDVWKWTLMILQPEGIVTRDKVDAAIATVEDRKGLRRVRDLRFETLHEGKAAQVLHVGPFDEEGPTIGKLHAFIEGHGALAGKHHEIYLSDIRRSDPAKWKTILRQPFR